MFYLCYGEYKGKRTLKLFLRYVRARFADYRQELAFRNYIADSMFVHGQGKYLTERLHDIMNRKIDNRSGDEIAADVIHRLGLKVQ